MKTLTMICAAMFGLAILGLTLPAAAENPPGTLVIADFENGPGPIKGEGKIVAEHASQGTHALKIEHPGTGYTGYSIEDKATLSKFKDYVLYKVDIFNPLDHPIGFGVRVDDAESNGGFGTRFNDERGTVAPPGWSTYELNVTGMRTSNSKNVSEQRRLDLSKLTLLKMFVGDKTPCVLYFDNIRLEPSILPAKVDGMRAFAFQSSKADVYPGFEPCNENSAWGKGGDYGVVNPDPKFFDTCYIPDALTANYGAADEFKVKLPDGKYVVYMCIDPFGTWGDFPHFSYRKVILNGKVVLDEKQTPRDYLDRGIFLHEDEEDLPGQDLWEKFVTPRNVPRTFATEVSGGVLSLKLDSDVKYGMVVQYLVIFPQAKADEGARWMAALTKTRKDSFNKKMIVSLPPAAAVKTKAVNNWGFVVFTASTEDYIYVNSDPSAAAPTADATAVLRMQAAKGERVNAQIGLYPLKDVSGVTVTVSDLSGPGGANIASSAVIVRLARNFLKREHRTWVGDLLPFLLQDFKTLDLHPGITRAVWLTLVTPGDAAPGAYSGTVKIGAPGAEASIPVSLTVYPFALDKVTDITLSATGARNTIPAFLESEMPEEYWQRVEGVMKDMADHGLNAVSGGNGFGPILRGVKNGKADIDYSKADRWMALAVKYGLTMPGDSYQGFDIVGISHETRKAFFSDRDNWAKKKFGVTYKELVGLAYNDVAAHAAANHWPKRLYYLLDEPRPESGNIETAAELIKIMTEASPTTLFSGYYSPGQGRDVYFETMPVSIAHTSRLCLQLTRKADKQLWEYDGSRSRAIAGRYLYVAARMGLKGYLTNGYMYVCSDPYFDWTGEESSWCVAWPSRHGVTDSVPWERVSDGINDYRYLSTLHRLIIKAFTTGKGEEEARAADAYMKENLKDIDLDDRSTARMTATEFAQFRKTMAGHIAALAIALGE